MLQATDFVAFAIDSIALGLALLRAGITSRWLRVSVFLLVVAGVGSLGLIWYPMDSPGPVTVIGDAHQTAGTIAGVALLAAALALAFAISSDPTWRGLTRTAAVTFTIALIGAVLSQFAIWWPHIGIPMGATMRLLALPLVILWGLVAWRLRRTCHDAASQSSGAR
ncbi:MAG: DUF998 domain-containing protein [Chloroflexi bacterium]|nr:DUF998 domain-containing protein [Chloroflexota bacterium]